MASQASTDQLNIVALSSKKILVPDMLNQVSSSLKTIASTWMTLPWNSYPFLETLVGLASVEPADDAKQLLDIASRQATELVLLGLVQIPVCCLYSLKIFILYPLATVESFAR